MFEVQFMVIAPHHLLFETFSSAQRFQCQSELTFQSMLIAVLQNTFPPFLCI